MPIQHTEYVQKGWVYREKYKNCQKNYMVVWTQKDSV